MAKTVLNRLETLEGIYIKVSKHLGEIERENKRLANLVSWLVAGFCLLTVGLIVSFIV